MKMLKIKKII